MTVIAAPATRGFEALPQEPSTTLREFVESSGLHTLVIGTSKYPNAKVTILLLSPVTGRPALAVKAPTTDVAACAVEREHRVLRELRACLAGPIKRTVPHVVDVVDWSGRPALVTTAVHGLQMTTTYVRWRHTARPALVKTDFAAVAAWLDDLQHETARDRGPVELAGGLSARLERRFPDEPLLGEAIDRLAQIDERLRGTTALRTAVHGDLWFGNVLLSGGMATGVVDWESGTTCGEALRDPVRFALMYALYLDRRTAQGRPVAGHPGFRRDGWGSGVEFALCGRGWFPDLFRRFLQDQLGRLGAAPGSWRDAALAGIAEVAAFTDDPEFAHRHLELFVRLAGRQPSRRPA